MKNIAILASGSGTNAENIIRYFRDNKTVGFPLVISNKPDAYVHKRAEQLDIPSFTINRAGFESGEALELLRRYEIDFIVLAGFLLKVPDDILKAYPNRIINIHPALLPKYGGKGMYGDRVHKAVVAAGEKETGITIHYINEYYDEGEILLQAACEVLPSDTPDEVAKKVHQLEYEYYPKTIEAVICEQ